MCLIRVGAKLCWDTGPPGPNLVTPALDEKSNNPICVHWLTGLYYCCRCLNEDYGIQCIQAAYKLLEKICKKDRQTVIPVACMNLVASVSDFAQVFHAEIILSLS